MDPLNLYKIIWKFLNRYFKSLSRTGYVQQKHIDNILVLIFITDLIELFPFEITKRDYNELCKAISHCAENSCMIDFPEYNVYTEVMLHRINSKIKVSENGIIRVTQNNQIMFTEQ